MNPGSAYTPGREIARGGMGAILSATDQTLDREVAMKVILAEAEASSSARQRFLREALVLARLEHPNIVPIHEMGRNAQGQLYYTMKLVKGRTLQAILTAIQQGDAATIEHYTLDRLLTIYRKVCDAMAFAHHQRIIHRDLKPENVMVGEFGEVLVMDWGLAKHLDDELHTQTEAERAQAIEGFQELSDAQLAAGESGLTMDGSVMGSPQYMPPEQAEGRLADIGTHSDIYSLGGILYAILTLRPPVEGRKVAEVLDNVKSGNITPPTHYSASRRGGVQVSGGEVGDASKAVGLPHCPDGKVPASLSAVTMRAMAFQPAERYANVAQIVADVEAYQGGFATSAENANALTLLRLFIRRHKTMTAAAALMVLLTMGFLGKVISSERAARAHALDSAQRLQELKGTAPIFYAQAQIDFETGKLDAALQKLGYAIQLDERVPGYSLLRAHYRQSSLKLAEAATDYRRVLELQPENQSAKVNLTLCEKLLREGAGTTPSRDHKLQLIAALRDQKRTLEAAPLAAEVAPDLNAARTAILGRLRDARKLAGWSDSRVSDLPDGTFKLEFDGLVPIDFSVLKGLPVSTLQFNRGDLTNLESLAGLALRELKLDGCPVTDLTPLAGMPLEVLDVSALPGRDGAKIIDLRPLRGMKLRELDLAYSRVADLSPLAGAPLEKLDLSSTRVEDLRPLANCTRLKWLHLEGTEVRDLTPLAGIPVEWLACDSRGVTSIAPLAGTPLRRLFLHETQITDLTALASCRQLEWLDISHTKVTDLAPLAGLPLTLLNCHGLKVTNLTPLRGRPLSSLILTKSSVTDLRPLAECPTLESLGLPDGAKDLSPLRKLPKLTLLSYGMNGGGGLPDRQMSPNQTATAFWRDYDTKSKTGAK